MDGLTLLRRAEAAGLTIHRDGDDLDITGPRSAAPIVEDIRQHKPDVLSAWWRWQADRLLCQVDDLDLRQDLADVFDEIAAHREHEQYQHRSEAEQIAFGSLIAAMLARGYFVQCTVNRRGAAA